MNEDVEAALTKDLIVNVFGLVRVANAFAEILENNQGALVQLNSVASIKNFSHLSTHSASKAASYSWTQGLWDDFGKKGASVLSVHPDPIATETADQASFNETAPTSTVSEGMVSALKAGDFHLFPDNLAKQVEGAYQSFSDTIVMANFSE